jgi:hypothetical protein
MYEQQIAKGMALLAERKPDYRDKLDLIMLDMGRTSYCVLGQVYGNFFNAMEELFGVRGIKIWPHAREHGFVLSEEHEYESHIKFEDAWGQLTAEWKAALSA